jgi:predicted molibdopterin-dependent oxidoreductase YjgC
MGSDNTIGLLHRVKERTGAIIRFTIDGSRAEARAGDTLLTAILLNGARLRKFEFGAGDRAGFCLMGACQDCWVRLEGGRVRACSTLVTEGMGIVTEGQRHV